jgi:4,4'-diaponeurosporenoate glycosyltransferase
VGDRVVEDMALADVARARGLPVAGLAGKGCVDFRMYPGGLREMVEGWTKGMAPGAGGTPPAARALMIAWIVGATTAVILLGLGIGALVHAEGGGPSRPAGEAGFGFAAVAIYLAYAAQVWWMLRRIGSFGLVTALAFPLPLAFFHGVFFRSAWLSRVGGSVAWRGRRVSLRRHPRRAGT